MVHFQLLFSSYFLDLFLDGQDSGYVWRQVPSPFWKDLAQLETLEHWANVLVLTNKEQQNDQIDPLVIY